MHTLSSIDFPCIKTEKCGTEMRTLHLGRLFHAEIYTSYGQPSLNVRETQTSALPALTATYLDVHPHQLLLRQPTDLRRQIHASQNLFEVWHLQERAGIVNLA